jgi:transposase
VRDWLDSKFSIRIFSRLTETPWPTKSPDLSPLDYCFWSVCLAELRRSPPSSLEDLKEIVGNFSDSLEKKELKLKTRNPEKPEDI